MSVSAQDVRHMASLARVGVDDARIPALVRELNDILAHMEALQAADIGAGDGDMPATSAGMPLRSDDAPPVALERTRESFAPAMRDGFFLVPRLETHGAADADSVDDA